MSREDEGADIYRTGQGLAVVTSHVQRQILRALLEGSKQLPELVQVTGRSKPTLSSLHMKELLVRGLVESTAHPTDSRRKMYHIVARPLEEPSAPASPTPLLSVATILDALAGPSSTPASLRPMLRAQGARIGAAVRPQLGALNRRDFWLRLPAILEENAIALPIRIDLQHGTVDLRPAAGLLAEAAAFAIVLEGFVAGLAGDAVRRGIEAQLTADGIRLHQV